MATIVKYKTGWIDIDTGRGFQIPPSQPETIRLYESDSDQSFVTFSDPADVANLTATLDTMAAITEHGLQAFRERMKG